MRDLARPHVSFFYDLPLPNRQAAGIQIFRTARALCEHGAEVSLFFGPLAGEDAVHAHYGTTPHPRLRIEPLFERRVSARRFRNWLHQWLNEVSDAPRHAVVGRGESGLFVFEQAARVVAPSNVTFIWEAHRTCTSQADAFFRPRLARRWRLRRHARRIAEMEQAALAVADGLVCVTEGVADALRASCDVPSSVLVLPGGTELRSRPIATDAERDIDVVYVGKLENRKGVPDLLAAMSHLPDVRLRLIGGDDPVVRRLEDQARTLGVHGRVRFEGYVAPAAVSGFLERARVGVCPLPQDVSEIADRFTCPLKILEMMAVGTPIVATDTAAVRNILTHGRTAWLVEPNAPRAIADGIRTLLEQRALAAELARNARVSVTDYAWSRRAARLLDFVQTVDEKRS